MLMLGKRGDKRTSAKGGHIGKLVNVKLEGMGGIGSRVHCFFGQCGDLSAGH